MGIIAWIILGLGAGLLGNLLIPGKRAQGLILTCLIGVAGALGGGDLPLGACEVPDCADGTRADRCRRPAMQSPPITSGPADGGVFGGRKTTCPARYSLGGRAPAYHAAAVAFPVMCSVFVFYGPGW